MYGPRTRELPGDRDQSCSCAEGMITLRLGWLAGWQSVSEAGRPSRSRSRGARAGRSCRCVSWRRGGGTLPLGRPKNSGRPPTSTGRTCQTSTADATALPGRSASTRPNCRPRPRFWPGSWSFPGDRWPRPVLSSGAKAIRSTPSSALPPTAAASTTDSSPRPPQTKHAAHGHSASQATRDRPDGAVTATAAPCRWAGEPVRVLDLTARGSRNREHDPVVRPVRRCGVGRRGWERRASGTAGDREPRRVSSSRAGCRRCPSPTGRGRPR